MIVIAVDFDGTIVKNKWPGIGKLRAFAKPILKWLYKRVILILYTCREGEMLGEAINALNKHQIKFDDYNQNYWKRIHEYGNDCRKVSADLYLDDRAFFPGWWAVPFVVLWMEWREKSAKRRSEVRQRERAV